MIGLISLKSRILTRYFKNKLNPTFTMEQNIFLYRNLQEISAVTFHEIKFTGNIFLLDKNYKEGVEYSTDQIIEINECWLGLYDEYFNKSDDPRYRKELRSRKQTFQLLCAITKGKEFLDLLQFISDNEEYVPNESHLEAVTTIGNGLKRLAKEYKFDIEKPLKENIKINESIRGGLQTRYQRLFKDDMNVEPKDIQVFYDIKARIEEALNKDYIPDYINMLQWLAYEKRYKQKISDVRKQHTRNRANPKNRRGMG